MQSRATDETGHLAIFCRMAYQSRRFIDDEQIRILKNNFKQFFQSQKFATETLGRREKSKTCPRRKLILSFQRVKEKLHKLLPVLFVAVLALSRIPHLLPPNFSVVYAFVFCAGVYFRGAMKWWLPFVTLLATDIALNIFYYHVVPFDWYLLLNYAIYAAIIFLGQRFGARAGFFKLLLGGLFGAFIFYLVTNTLAWFQDAGYAKTFAGWIQALTTGHPEIRPTTWEMFRNTLLSTGIFTALFVAAEKSTSAAESPADKTAGARAEEPEAEPKEAEA
jgi:hypothetical protein